MNQATLLDVFKFLTKQFQCQVLTRQEILKASARLGYRFAESYVDTTRRRLTVCGYLSDTDKPGHYLVEKPVPADMTTHALRKLYHQLLDYGHE